MRVLASRILPSRDGGNDGQNADQDQDHRADPQIVAALPAACRRSGPAPRPPSSKKIMVEAGTVGAPVARSAGSCRFPSARCPSRARAERRIPILDGARASGERADKFPRGAPSKPPCAGSCLRRWAPSSPLPRAGSSFDIRLSLPLWAVPDTSAKHFQPRVRAGAVIITRPCV